MADGDVIKFKLAQTKTTQFISAKFNWNRETHQFAMFKSVRLEFCRMQTDQALTNEQYTTKTLMIDDG